MNDERHNGHGSPSVEGLDLVTAELRTRVAGIGLAISELRHETERLRAAADARGSAVALLDYRRSVDDATWREPSIETHVDRAPIVESEGYIPMVWAPGVSFRHDTGAAVITAPDVSRSANMVIPPVPAWGTTVGTAPVSTPASARADAAQQSVPGDHRNSATVQVDATTWVPGPPPSDSGRPSLVMAPMPLVSDPVSTGPAAGTAPPVVDAQPPVTETSTSASLHEPGWAPLDEESEAAFDRFFSAEVEQEPAQRWLLSE